MGHQPAGRDVADQAELAAAVDDQGADAQDLDVTLVGRRSGGAGTALENEKPVSTTRSSKYIRLPPRELWLFASLPLCTNSDLRSAYRRPRRNCAAERQFGKGWDRRWQPNEQTAAGGRACPAPIQKRPRVGALFSSFPMACVKNAGFENKPLQCWISNVLVMFMDATRVAAMEDGMRTIEKIGIALAALAAAACGLCGGDDQLQLRRARPAGEGPAQWQRQQQRHHQLQIRQGRQPHAEEHHRRALIRAAARWT